MKIKLFLQAMGFLLITGCVPLIKNDYSGYIYYGKLPMKHLKITEAHTTSHTYTDDSGYFILNRTNPAGNINDIILQTNDKAQTDTIKVLRGKGAGSNSYYLFLGKSIDTLYLDRESGFNQQEPVKTKASGLPTIGGKIQGDFNGDGHTDTAASIKIKEGQGNPVEDGTADEYEIQFSANNLKSINIGCCATLLINEGDLNNDGTDEISIFQAPMNGCTYSMTTYSLINGNWKQIIEPFLIPTACEILSKDDLQKRIFKENNAIYYYYADPNAKNRKLFKKEAVTK